MKRYLHLLLTLMLLSVCTVGGAQTTVTYTVLNKSEVSSTDAPTGTTATYTSTYDTKYQLTKDKSMTLTLSGYAGKKITGLKFYMGSNKSSGSGYLDAKVGTKTLASLGSSKSGVVFKNWYNNTSYSTDYKVVNATVTATTVEDGEKIVITIGATANSLYVQTFTLTYEEASSKTDAGLSFSETTATAKLGETFNAPKLTNPHNLNVTYASSNESVATVDATGAVTPVAVGTTTITAKSDETETYDAGEASYTLTVKDNTDNTVFTETFDQCGGKGGNDGNWSGSIATSTLTADNTGWIFNAGYGASKCAKIGGSSTQGSAKTPSISLTGNGTLTFKAGAWKGDATTLNISATGATLSQSSVTLADSKFTDYSIDITNANGSVTITFKAGQKSKNRFFLDDVVVSEATTAAETYTPATLSLVAKSGNDYYATFSSDQVTFFPNDVTVYGVVAENNQLTMTSGEDGLFTSGTVTIDDNEVKGYYVPANTGVMINAIDASVTYYTVANKTVDAIDNSFNMLYPATKAMSDLGDSYYFYKLAYDDYSDKTGLGFYWGADNGAAFTAKTNGAYLAVPKSSGSAKSGFRFDGTTTGVNTINAKTTTNDVIYNIQGQRVGANYKGLVIVNGKKMMRK